MKNRIALVSFSLIAFMIILAVMYLRPNAQVAMENIPSKDASTHAFVGLGIDLQPDQSVVGQPVIFVATGIPKGATVQGYTWTSDDGGSTSAMWYEHVFNATGMFTITLNVKLVDGRTGIAAIRFVVEAVAGSVSFIKQPALNGSWISVTIGTAKAGYLVVDVVNISSGEVQNVLEGNCVANGTIMSSGHQSYTVPGCKFRATLTSPGKPDEVVFSDVVK